MIRFAAIACLLLPSLAWGADGPEKLPDLKTAAAQLVADVDAVLASAPPAGATSAQREQFPRDRREKIEALKAAMYQQAWLTGKVDDVLLSDKFVQKVNQLGQTYHQTFRTDQFADLAALYQAEAVAVFKDTLVVTAPHRSSSRVPTEIWVGGNKKAFEDWRRNSVKTIAVKVFFCGGFTKDNRASFLYVGATLVPGIPPPATQPDRPDLPVTSQSLAEAEAAVNKARAAIIAHLESSPEYKAAAADVAAKQKALEAARANGTSQERVNASSAFNAARAAMERMKSEALSSDLDLRMASRAKADAQAALDQKTARAAADKRSAEVTAAERALRPFGPQGPESFMAQAIRLGKEGIPVGGAGAVAVSTVQGKALQDAVDEGKRMDAAVFELLDSGRISKETAWRIWIKDVEVGMPAELLNIYGYSKVRAESATRKIVEFEPWDRSIRLPGQKVYLFVLEIKDGKVNKILNRPR